MSYDSPTLKGMRNLPIGAAFVVVALLVCVTILSALDKPVTELIGLGTLVLGGLLYGEVKAVREQTNGNTHKLLSMVDKSVSNGGTTDAGAGSGTTGDGAESRP